MLELPESSASVFVMIRCKSVSICNGSHPRRANSGEITILRGSLFDALTRGESLHLAARNLFTRN